MLICRNAEGAYSQIKVRNPWFREWRGTISERPTYCRPSPFAGWH